MIAAHCPACSGPMHWHEETARALVGERSPDEPPRTLSEALDERAVRALRAAVRALEDSAAGVRWRMSRADAPLRLDEELVRLEQDIAVLHELIRPRAYVVAAPAPRQPAAKPRKPAAAAPARLARAHVA